MRIAAYAPLKPIDHPVPSGDRRVARLIDAALREAGHSVEWAARLRSRDGAGNPDRQARIARLGAGIAARLVRRWRAASPQTRPDLWFTYHLYYKAPDHVGPAVADALGIPYVVAEASVAMKRAGGPWDLGHRATLAALARADAVIALNPGDREAVDGRLRAGAKRATLAPFLDVRPYAAAATARDMHRDAWARRLRIDAGVPWLVAVAMKRPGDKLDSYRVLGAALERLAARDWRLIVAGDGPARVAVDTVLAPLGSRVTHAGQIDEAALPGLLAACDLFTWPAVGEAYGMALLEAHATGLPAVAGEGPGVAAILAHAKTGLLVPPRDDAAFAAAVAALLDDPARLAAYGHAAAAKAARAHGLGGAARSLDALLAGLGARQ